MLKRYFIIPDVHFPYECKPAMASMFYFLRDFKPDVVVQLGDLVDFYALSSYSKDPNRLLTIQDELDMANNFWKKVKQICPKADLYMKSGNHEDRFQKVLWTKPELSPIKSLKLSNLLGCDDYGVTFVESHQKLVFEDVLQITHGKYISANSGSSALKELTARRMSGVSGHVHRAGKVIDPKNGKNYSWVESGYLGERVEGFEFMGDLDTNWMKAVTVGYIYDNDGLEVKLDLVEADSKNCFLYNDKLYTPKGILTF